MPPREFRLLCEIPSGAIITYLAWRSCFKVGTPSRVSQFDFSDNFVSKNSAPIQNFTSWHCRREHIFDCSVSRQKGNSQEVLLEKDIRHNIMGGKLLLNFRAKFQHLYNYMRNLSFKIVSNFTRLTAPEIKYNNFQMWLVVLMPNITTNHAITYTNL